jgi:hypothetical protein
MFRSVALFQRSNQIVEKILFKSLTTNKTLINIQRYCLNNRFNNVITKLKISNDLLDQQLRFKKSVNRI